jgi:O-antigen/teichoic acid export membrane protein
LSELGVQAKRPSAEGQLATGTSLVLAGQAAFVVCGYLLHFYTSRSLGAVAFGTYGVIMNVLNWMQNALNNGVPWAVRRFLAADPDSSTEIIRNGLFWQIIVGSVLFVGSVALAPWFGSLTSDSAMTPYLRLAVIDLLTMALYTFYRGALNGFHLFAAQGVSLAAYAVAKLAFSVMLVGAGYSVAGALIGNTMGTVAGWLVSWWLLRRATDQVAAEYHGNRPAYGGRALLSFALPTVVFTLASSFLTNIGLVAVKAIVRDEWQVAYYSAANQLALAPSLLLVTFSWTLFPLLAKSIAARDAALTRTYIRTALRLLALVLMPGLALVLGTAPDLLSIVYPAHFGAAAPLLNLLILGTGLYSVYMVFANAILAEGRTLLALGVPSAMVPISFSATWYLAQRMGAVGAALAAVLTIAVAALLHGTYVLRRFAVQPDWTSLLRIAGASLIIYTISRVYVPRGLVLVSYYAALGAAYLGLLLLFREIAWRDLRQWQSQLRHLLRPRSAGSRT